MAAPPSSTKPPPQARPLLHRLYNAVSQGKPVTELAEAYTAANLVLGEWPLSHRQLNHIAIDKGHLHTVEWLCENSPTREEDYESTDRKKNPLLFACSTGNLSVVRHLLTCPHIKEASFSARLRNVPLLVTCKALYCAAKIHGDEERQRRILKIVRFLLLSPHAWKYDINTATDSLHLQNATLLKLMICATKDLHILKLLLHLGADPTICDIPHVLGTGDVSFIESDQGRKFPEWGRGAIPISSAMVHLLRQDARDWRVYRLMKARVICDVEHAVEKEALLRAIDVCLRERVCALREEGKGKGERHMEGGEEEHEGLMPLPSVSIIKREPQRGKAECTEMLVGETVKALTTFTREEEAKKKRPKDETIDAVITHILHGGLKQELLVELCAMVRERDAIGQKGREFLNM